MNRLSDIASFVAGFPAGSIAPAALERAKLALIDFTGVAIAGSVEPVAKIIANHIARSARGNATVIGTAIRASAADAALANAVAGHALDFDDSNFVLGGHPSVTLLPALLAVGEERGRGGRDILDAYVIGFEVMMKFARAVNFEHYEKGWHPTATLGTFGATAAVARLLRLPDGVIQHALGLAASMASGVKANFGAMAKPLQVGQASQKGVLCAQLAADGLTASAAAVEGRQGFLAAYNGAGNCRPEELTAFGDTLEIIHSGLMFKKYPCCGATHAPIDAALVLVRTHRLRGEEIGAITIVLNQRRLPHVDRPVVTTGLEAKFSVQYCVAAALADGAISLRHFGDAAIARRDLQDLTARVTASGVDRGESLSQACELKVRLKDGSTRFIQQADAEGRAADDYPAYMETKFTDCVSQVFDPAYVTQLLPQLRSFERCANVTTVMGLLAQSRPAATKKAMQS
jgi:2-methylcitrate dehydratase PrpD